MKTRLFSYNYIDTYVHNLSGFTKLLCFLALTFTVMFTFDIRVIAFITALSVAVFIVSKISLKQVRLMIVYVALFIIFNETFVYIFAPGYGSRIFGTAHALGPALGRYTLTEEQLFYQLVRIMKYVATIPLGMVFILTTDPSEFSSSINKIGLPYKTAYALALTLRYFPDIAREYNNISLSQQARGLEMSRKAGVASRVKNAFMILVPLVFSTLDRIESISNAMDLRGFGKNKKRTWYSSRRLAAGDYAAIGVTLAILIISILISIFINHSRFYNPFV